MSLQTEKIIATEYVETPSFTTAEIDAKILALELPAGSMVFNSDTSAMNISTGVGITPVIYSPGLSHVVSVSAATVLASDNSLPIILVPAQGAGTVIYYIGHIIGLDYGSAPFDFSASLFRFGFPGGNNIENSGGWAYIGGVSADAIGTSIPAAQNGYGGTLATFENQPLITFWDNGFGAPTGGTGGTLTITTYYSVFTL